jgi:hypothetical protein
MECGGLTSRRWKMQRHLNKDFRTSCEDTWEKQIGVRTGRTEAGGSERTAKLLLQGSEVAPHYSSSAWWDRSSLSDQSMANIVVGECASDMFSEGLTVSRGRIWPSTATSPLYSATVDSGPLGDVLALMCASTARFRRGQMQPKPRMPRTVLEYNGLHCWLKMRTWPDKKVKTKQREDGLRSNRSQSDRRWRPKSFSSPRRSWRPTTGESD